MELRGYLRRHWEKIKRALFDGTYKPLPARRKEIPKEDGGVRLLGIPTVLDRLIQQAIAQVLLFLWFDKELERRGLRFVRYADDVAIYVRTAKAAERVKRSISRFITGKLTWKQWKLPRTRVRNLMARGAIRKWAVMVGNTRIRLREATSPDKRVLGD